jgi:6-phosphogluconolactonase (cycloisomerase 2 family)
MWTRLTWIAAILVVVAIGFLMACSTKYSHSSNGLVVIPTQASSVMQTFSLDLANGHISQINNAAGPPTSALPTSVILNPAGTFAYVLVNQSPNAGIEAFPVGSDGKLAAGTTTNLKPLGATVTVQCVTPTGPLNVSVNVPPVPVMPIALSMDSAGKYLFVADAATSGQTSPYQCNGSTLTATVQVPGAVSVFALNGGGLSEVQSPLASPFVLPSQSGGQAPSASALAVTPTVVPVQYAACSTHTPSTTENLYVTDSANQMVLNYSVDTSTGVLTLKQFANNVPGISTGSVPSGVAVDPCNRFVYVSNQHDNSVSAYSICTAASVVPPICQQGDFSLNAVAGSPFVISPGDGPGPLAVDPYGNFLYVVDTASSQLTAFRIGSSSGGLTTVGTYATGQGANSIAIRSDDTWLFVANSTSSNLSEYAITPASGILAPQGPTTTLNTPSGVAVK